MTHAIFPAEADALAYQGLVDKLLSLPLRDAVHVGGGRHVEVHPTVPGPGWTIHHASVHKHPTKLQWAHAIVDPATVSDPGELTAGELDALAEEVDKAVELGEDWTATELAGP